MEHLVQLEENIKQRAKYLTEAVKSDKVKQTLIAICEKSPEFFFEFFLCTDRNPWLIPDKYWNIIPFLLFDFQKEYLEDAWNAILMWSLPVNERTEPTDLFSEKSRQMWFSWMYAWLQLYAYIFHDMKSLYISMKSDEVDRNWDIKSHFEKIRFMIRALPKWILPEWLDKESWTEHNKSMVISRGDWTWVIKWESANPNAWRWGTTNFTIFDEMAFMQYAQAINMSIASSTPCRLFNSTPCWEWNEYYRMRKLALEWKIRYHKCHWSENPFYTTEWYNWRVQWMTPEQIAQELEIDYNLALEGRVYPWFRVWNEVIKYDYSLPLYIFMDNSHWWADPHAIIIAQKKEHKIFIIDTCEFNCSPRQMAEIMAKQPSITMTNKQLNFYNKYKEMKTPIFISDCYDTHTTVWDNTIFGYYQNVWIFLNIPWNRNKKEQIQITKSNIDNLIVSEICSDFSSAIQNSRYPEIKENTNRTTPALLPIHDWCSHYRTALEYWVVWLSEQEKRTSRPKQRVAIQKKNPITGEITNSYVTF